MVLEVRRGGRCVTRISLGCLYREGLGEGDVVSPLLRSSESSIHTVWSAVGMEKECITRLSGVCQDSGEGVYHRSLVVIVDEIEAERQSRSEVEKMAETSVLSWGIESIGIDCPSLWLGDVLDCASEV